MKKRLIIHAGFHKTATTTVQAFFDHNHQVIADKVLYVPKSEVNRLLRDASDEMKVVKPAHMLRFIAVFCAYLDQWIESDKEIIFVTSEDFLGRMPGKTDEPLYGNAKFLLQMITEILAEMSDQLDYVFYFSAREQKDWSESRFYDCQQKPFGAPHELSQYVEFCQDHLNISKLMEEYKTLLGERHFHSAFIEDYQHLPFGPAEPLLNLIFGSSRPGGLSPVANLRVNQARLDAADMGQIDK